MPASTAPPPSTSDPSRHKITEWAAAIGLNAIAIAAFIYLRPEPVVVGLMLPLAVAAVATSAIGFERCTTHSNLTTPGFVQLGPLGATWAAIPLALVSILLVYFSDDRPACGGRVLAFLTNHGMPLAIAGAFLAVFGLALHLAGGWNRLRALRPLACLDKPLHLLSLVLSALSVRTSLDCPPAGQSTNATDGAVIALTIGLGAAAFLLFWGLAEHRWRRDGSCTAKRS